MPVILYSVSFVVLHSPLFVPHWNTPSTKREELNSVGSVVVILTTVLLIRRQSPF